MASFTEKVGQVFQVDMPPPLSVIANDHLPGNGKPGSYALNVFRGSAGGLGSNALRLLTPCRRKHRSRPDRETFGFKNSRVTARRSSSGSRRRRRN
jgi:hypothetical protein